MDRKRERNKFFEESTHSDSMIRKLLGCIRPVEHFSQGDKGYAPKKVNIQADVV